MSLGIGEKPGVLGTAAPTTGWLYGRQNPN